MTLKLAVGYGTKLIEAKERAIYFYEQAEGRKVFRFVETQPGKNEIDQDVWVTTIWFETIEPTPEEKNKEEEKYLFIGSDDIDPNDPNWKEKWEARQAGTPEVTNDVSVQAHPTVEFDIHKAFAESITR